MGQSALKLMAAAAGLPSDPNFSSVTFLMHADSNPLTDFSSSGHSITAAGNATSSTAEKKFGAGSLKLDGTGDYIDVGTDVTVLGSGDFTVEFWLKTSDTSFNIANPDTSTGSGFWGLLVQSGDLRWNDSYAVSNLWVVDGAGIIDNAWHHVAIVRTSNNFKVFYDGTSQSVQSGSFSDSTNYSGSDVLRVGSGNLDELNGYIDDMRITKGVARYTSNFTAPTEAFPNR